MATSSIDVGCRDAAGAVRIVRVGLLGLGRVGQSVARLAARSDAGGTTDRRIRVDGALVRHVTAPRRCPRPARLTSNPSAFLRGDYDVVIEALGGLEPARTLVARLLGRGIPVVTANAPLIAAHGSQLSALAARRGTTLRIAASTLAGVPISGRSHASVHASRVDRFTAIVDGHEADDAADRLVVLAHGFGWGLLNRRAIEVKGGSGLTPADLHAARLCGGTIRPIVSAARVAHGVEAFAGPAWVPAAHPLATVGNALTAIELRAPYAQPRFFSGPAPDPALTAAGLIDAAIETASAGESISAPQDESVVPVCPPVTPWLVRLSFPGIGPRATAVRELAANGGVAVEHVVDTAHGGPSRDASWLLVAPTPRASLAASLGTLAHVHRLTPLAIRRIEA